ncbi:adenosine deaminase [Arthrobacter sp. NamB2]|uniref:adenosine deaminase n=1 Tax=Arthrobacter sp. NamB2 TaxID=2576035 RepID=UPI0010C9EA86|nr:adenosine deaminase [Arthrobacter sp. NamB2]TKV29385.1 adenosine deaminase [Arthrobacter sp. NamB2]
MLPLPCAELHLHIEGTLEPDLIFELAGRNGISLPYADAADLAARYAFSDLQSFLDLYYAAMTVLRTEQDFEDMTRAYLRRASAAGVRHAEIMMDPQAHLARGVALETCVNGVAAALATSEAEFGISTALIAAFLRDRPAAEALGVLRELIAMDAPIIGIGLDSAEVGFPPSLFAEVYDLARTAGLKCVAHAGEEGPPAYIREALDILRVDRIDHGIRCLEDDALVERLVADRVPLTVCPLSNVRLRAVDTIADHPLPQMLARGLSVSVNSDDPAYFGGYLDDNVQALEAAFGLGPDDLAMLAANSFRSAFLQEDRRTVLLAEVDSWLVAARRSGVS